MKPLTEVLIENSKSAIISCVELHNKPRFDYRYEIATILAINGWELLLKAYINENHEEVKLIQKDGRTKPVEECLKFVSSTKGKDFSVINENLMKIYEYRNNIIHFYKDPIDEILYSLLHKNVILYNEFLKENFNFDLSEETNLFLLPIGFKPFSSPVDFLSSKSKLKESSYAVKEFIKSILTSTNNLQDEGVEDSILTGFNIAVVNENRIKNADIIVGITKDETKASVVVKKVISGEFEISNDAKNKIQIEEESLFKTVYTLSYGNVVSQCRNLYSDFKQNPVFNRIMKNIKGDSKYHKKRYLDPVNKNGTAKDWYSQSILEKLNEHYVLKEKKK